MVTANSPLSLDAPTLLFHIFEVSPTNLSIMVSSITRDLMVLAPVIPSLKFPVMVELISLTSRLTSMSLFWKMENSIATAGTIETTNRASFALMENMTTMDPIR